jgi:hypothetical protein
MKHIVFFLVVFSVFSLFAVNESGQNNLGFSAGELTRSGIAYRHWKADWGFHVSGMLFADKDEVPGRYDFREGISSHYTYIAYGKELKTNLGLSIMRTLQKIDNRRFYAFAGYGLHHKEEKRWLSEDSDMDDAWEDGYKVVNTHFWGLGVGFDLEIYEYMRVYIEIPLTFKSNNEITMYVPQVGIFYRF